MFQALFNSLSGLFSFSRSLDTVSNNVSNMNTPGFRGSDSFFANIDGGYGTQIAGQGLRPQPGDMRQLFVRPGVTRVVLIDLRGNVRYSTVLDVDKGETTIVDLRNGPNRGPVPVHVSVAERDRPSRY